MLFPNFRVKKLTTGKAFASHAILEAEKTAAYQRGGRAENALTEPSNERWLLEQATKSREIRSKETRLLVLPIFSELSERLAEFVHC